MNPTSSASGEALLRAWLGLAAILNHRMVSGITYNEAVVCNYILFQQSNDPTAIVTATMLCKMTGLLKSQMNQVLSSLETQGYLVRSRSVRDRRRVELQLTDAGVAAYYRSHAQAAYILSELEMRMGQPALDGMTSQLQIFDATIRDILDKRQKGTL